MRFFIGETDFSGKPIEEIVTAIKKLPQPKIIRLQENLNRQLVNPSQTVLCLQREIAYVDRFQPHPYNIKHIGSKDAVGCLVLYLYSEHDHLVIHVDTTTRFHLDKVLLKFSDKNIKIKIAGGYSSELSEKSLRSILKELISVSNNLDLQITICEQKIIENNNFSLDIKDEDVYEFIYDKIIEKGKILYFKVFNRHLDVNIFERLTPNALKDNSKTLSPQGRGMMALLITVSELNKKMWNQTLNAARILNISLQDEKVFFQLINEAFCSEGFKIMDMSYRLHDLYRSSGLSHFVFDMDSKDIVIIPTSMTTPFETERSAAVIDPSKADYFLCYNGEKNKYKLPTFSSSFIQTCQQGQRLLNQLVVSEEEIAKFTSSIPMQNTVPCVNRIMQFIRKKFSAVPQETENAAPLNMVLFRKYNDFYCPDSKQEIVTQNLLLLNEVFDQKFVAKQRLSPSHVIDGVLSLPSAEKALNIKKQLKQKNIYSIVIKSQAESYFICVPAINVKKYGDRIMENLTNRQVILKKV